MSVAARCLALSVFAAFSTAAVTAPADSWPRFRGPNGSGVQLAAAPTPITWSDTKHVQWKADLPGPGASCPIVVGDQIFITCWSGYGMERGGEPGDQQQLRRHLLSIDRNTGQVQWDREVEPYLPEDEYGGMFAEHGYASHTPVSDGKRVYVFFGKTGALAFDLEGNRLWHNPQLGTESDPNGWGSAASPIVYKNLLIVTASAESESIVALDTETGEEVWRAPASTFSGTWGTPVLVEVDQDRTDLVIEVPGEMWGFNPETGKLRWFSTAVDGRFMCSSVVTHGDVIYAMEAGPGGGGGVAIRAGGNGDVSATHVLWRNNAVSRIGTPLYYDGRIYAFARGQVACYDAANGEEIFRERLRGGSGGGGGRGGQDYASAVLADGKIYYTTRRGEVFVIEAGRELNQLAVNKLGQDGEDFSATPAITDEGQILIRSSKALYCVALNGDQPESIDQANFEAPAEEPAEEAEQRQRGPGGQGGGGRFDPAAMFNRQDANSDGKIAGDELTGRWRDSLEQNDTDKDGAITLEEFRAGMRNMFNRGGGGGQRGNRRDAGNEDRPGRADRPASEGEGA